MVCAPFEACLIRIQRSRSPVATVVPEGDHATAPAFVESIPGFGATQRIDGGPYADATPAVVATSKSEAEAEASADTRRTNQVNIASLPCEPPNAPRTPSNTTIEVAWFTREGGRLRLLLAEHEPPKIRRWLADCYDTTIDAQLQKRPGWPRPI